VLLGLIALTDAQAQTVAQSGYTAIFQGVSEETATITGSSVGGGTEYDRLAAEDKLIKLLIRQSENLVD
jgi:hypothetical protein